MLLKHGGFTNVFSVWKFSRTCSTGNHIKPQVSVLASHGRSEVRYTGPSRISVCSARRRAAYDDQNEEEDAEEYGYNKEIGILEIYSESAPAEALLVQAVVDNQEEEVLIFKGYSSCLTTYRTSPNPSRSVLPARAIIKSIDRVKGPFDPSNIHYLEKGLTWETFKTRLHFNDP